MRKHTGKTIKAIFFDHDDTLVGTIGPKWAQHKHVAKKHFGKDLSDDDIKSHWGKPLSQLICLLYEIDEPDKGIKALVECNSEFPKDLFDFTLSTLAKIKKSNVLIGVVTSTSRLSFGLDLEHHGFDPDIFDFTQTEDDTDFHKPDPKVFDPTIKWLSKIGIKPEEVLYVGDSLLDMQAAQGAGFNFVGVETGLIKAEIFTKNGAKSLPNISHLIHST